MLRIMKSAWLLLIPTLAMAGGGLFSKKDEFPPPQDVFRYAVKSEGQRLTVYWNVASGYYLYKSRLGLESATPGVTVGKAQYPRGEIHHDEYLGDQEIYRDDFTVTAPITRTTSATNLKLKLNLKLQGCADAGLCYPPTVWTTNVSLKKQ
jgi:thioredoxin:protein disulfide reductase